MESKLEKLEKWENSKTDEDRRCQNQKKLCKSIMTGVARRKREKHAILSEI